MKDLAATRDEDRPNPVCITVLWDDAMNPDLRLIKAIRALMDRSLENMSDEGVDAALAYLLAERNIGIVK